MVVKAPEVAGAIGKIPVIPAVDQHKSVAYLMGIAYRLEPDTDRTELREFFTSILGLEPTPKESK